MIFLTIKKEKFLIVLIHLLFVNNYAEKMEGCENNETRNFTTTPGTKFGVENKMTRITTSLRSGAEKNHVWTNRESNHKRAIIN